ncbi:Hypothetical predicted protein [Octopus vulgaris]|uniref:Uncharacterized protein n=1 Tax=Octopus vulgaris TaxID=6645 RepID=A0AA36F9P5_OCTVU|nr:Hypothetical predicted protein [Octopus vulgaris]
MQQNIRKKGFHQTQHLIHKGNRGWNWLVNEMIHVSIGICEDRMDTEAMKSGPELPKKSLNTIGASRSFRFWYSFLDISIPFSSS